MFLSEITQGEVTTTVICTVLLLSAIFVGQRSSRMLAKSLSTSSEAPQFAQSSLREACDYLEFCLAKESDRYPEMFAVWHQQVRPAIDAYMLGDDGSNAYQRRELGMVLSHLIKFRDTYADYLPKIDSNSITSFITLTESESYIETVLSLINAANIHSDPLRRIKKFKKSMDFLSDGAIQYFQAAMVLNCGDSFFDSYRGIIAYILDKIRIDFQSVRPNDRHKFEQVNRDIDKSAKALYWELERVFDRRSPELNFLVELDLEKKMPIIYESDSAEAKAIQRVRNPVSDDEWELAYKPGDQFDVDDLDAQLKACGYID
jgi:hypothetical protein